MTKPTRRRSPGEGSVFRYRSGWRGSIAWTAPDGSRHRRTVSAATAEEARAKLDELRAKLRLGALTPSPSPTLADYLAAWVERDRPRVRASTWRVRELHVRAYLVPSLGRIRLERLSAADVERAMAEWLASGPLGGRGPVSPLTVRHVRATLRRALADAVRDGYLVRNVAADARPPRLPHRPITYLAPRDLARLLTATADDEFGPLFTVAATTGLRLGELLGLRWVDVDLAARTLSVRQALARTYQGWAMAEPKSARSRRTIPLPTRAVEALAVARQRQRFARAAAGDAWQEHGLVFADAVGRPLKPDAVSRAFRIACERAGVPRVRFHDLRHSTATALLAAGVPLATISEWLGHSGIAVTAAAYAAVVPDLLRGAAEAMDRALGGEP